MDRKFSLPKLAKVLNKDKDTKKGFSFSRLLIDSQNLRVYTAENMAKNSTLPRHTS